LDDLDSLRQAAQTTDLIPAIERLKAQLERIQAAPYAADTFYEGMNFPAGVSLPVMVAYDGTTMKLAVIGKISEADLNALKAQSNGPDFGAAIDRLIDQVKGAVNAVEGIRKRMPSYVLPLHTASLAQMPATVPQIWAGRFFFQPSTPLADSHLAFMGLMTETDKQALLQLAISNTGYTTAIEQLYKSSHTIPANPEFINEAIAEQLIFDEHTGHDRIIVVLKQLLPYLRKQIQIRFLIERVSNVFGLDTILTERLLSRLQTSINGQPESLVQALLASNYADSDSKVILTRTGFEQQFNALELLYKVGVMVSRLGLSAKHVDWLLSGTWVDLLELNALPRMPLAGSLQFAKWVNLVLLAQLRESLPGGEATLERIYDLLNQDPAPNWDSFQNALADQLNWAPSDFKLLLSGNGLNFNRGTDDFKTSQRLKQFADCLALILKLGSTAEMVLNWKKAELTARDATAARQLVRSRYDQATWYELAPPRQNKLRQKRRAALLHYLIAREGVRDANDLFGKYLIDPEMGDCMMTTRILQATSAVQLFIQRCLMGLEPDVPANSINRERWQQWMKNYRVWEANRKVFFYPENWIEPELRDDKSPFFEELESELLQGDITSEKAVSALSNYLAKLDEVSRLEVVGLYRDTPKESDGQPKYGYETLHVFGRTYIDPHKYFYRCYQKLGFAAHEGFWTAWRPIDLDIEGSNLLFPVVWQKKPYLFWLTFSEKADEPDPPKNQPTTPNKYWIITLNWSAYENGKWQAKRVFQVDRFMRPGYTSLAFSIFHKSTYVLMGQDNLSAIRLGLIGPYRAAGELETVSKKIQQLNIDGYGVDITADSNFANFPDTYRRITPVFTWDKISEESKKSLAKRTPVGFVTADNYRIIYSHQELDRGFWLRAPSVLTPSKNTPQGSLYTEPSLFFLSDPQNHSFFGYPYWKWKGTFSIDLQTRPGRGLPVVGTTRGFTSAENRGFVRGFLEIEEPHILFTPFYHPQTQHFQQSLRESGVRGLLQLKSQRDSRASNVFSDLKPDKGMIPDNTWPNLDVDFSSNGGYSQYNWELFFHLPFTIATHLAKNQRFEEARQWFHYVFDPTDASQGAEPERFWRFRPFHENARTSSIQRLIRILSTNHYQEQQEKKDFELQISQWLGNPFRPHAVARWRNRAYMFSVVMKYLDNLIAWGDQLFRRDTRESLNEALQIYVLAAQILGRKPISMPRRSGPRPQSFADIRGRLDSLSNIQVAAENILPPSSSLGQVNNMLPAMPSLLFCVPENPKILEYYDKVADRLFNLRNCMTIDGVKRQLPLFDPPIDPAILVKATAAGIDLSTALSDLNAPLPLYRFHVMTQKATELCTEVKSLGGALLAALEKGDAEAVALLRSQHEISLLQQQRQIKELQVEEAKASTEALAQSLESAQTRLTYYLSLISTLEELAIPTGPAGPQAINLITAALNTVGKTADVLKAITSVVNPLSGIGAKLLNAAIARATEALSDLLPTQGGDTNKVPMIPAERRQLEELKQSHDLQQRAKDYQSVAQMMSMLPDITLGIQGFSSSPVIQAQVGGTLLSKLAQLQASFIDYESSEHTYRANLHSILAGHQRRAGEWLHQAQLARLDMEQIIKQGTVAALRLKTTSEELLLHDRQIENAEIVEEFMRSKYSNKELYDWMVGQISNVYFQSYQLAYDVAKRAEKAYRFELGLQDSETSFIQFGYWDSLKKGLLAGERLHHDLKRMEVAYLDRHRREYELIKHVSLRQLNPTALLDLKTTGTCEAALPEWLFDLDTPGHYLRRIKNMSLSIPAVTGPYTNVNCTLSLLKSTLRRSPLIGQEGYRRAPNEEDTRFVDYYGMIQSIVTSTGQNDSGMFETNLRDERFLPFEGAGAESIWKLDLPKDYRTFDYNTISDVILHIRYTARQGVNPTAVKTALDEVFKEVDQSNLALLLSLRHDFPTEWAVLANGAAEFTTTIRKEHFPYFVHYLAQKGQKQIQVAGLELYGQDGKKHSDVGDVAAATTDLKDHGQQGYVIKIKREKFPAHKPDTQVFLIIRYSLT
jgi:hypothetical protein